MQRTTVRAASQIFELTGHRWNFSVEQMARVKIIKGNDSWSLGYPGVRGCTYSRSSAYSRSCTHSIQICSFEITAYNEEYDDANLFACRISHSSASVL